MAGQQQLQAFLLAAGLEKYATTFAREQLDLDLLAELTNDDFRELGVPIGDRKRLARALAERGASTAEAGRDDGAPDRRQLTVVFCDMVGSTDLARTLDVEDWHEVLRQFHTVCRDAIERNGGYLSQYLGDGVLAYFGYPSASETDTERAVYCAVEVVNRLKMQALHGRTCETRVGIATGVVLAGEVIGEGDSRERSVVGETPNLAARLQALAGPGDILISDRSRQNLGGLFDCEWRGEHAVKGFPEPVAVWAVRRASEEVQRFRARQTGREMLPLLGRDQELERVEACWLRAQRPANEFLMIEGEAGIGKSRLIEAFVQPLVRDAVPVARLQCVPHADSTAFYPALQFVGRKLNRAGVTPPEQVELLEASCKSDVQTAVLASLLGLPDPVDGGDAARALTPEQRRACTFDALVACLQSELQGNAGVLIFEDLHWADPSTLQLIARLDESTPTGKLVIGTCRPEFEHPWAPNDRRSWLKLRRLNEFAAQALIARALEASGVSATSIPHTMLDDVLAHGDGVPLFLEEITRNVANGAHERHDGAQDRDAFEVPGTLKDSLMGRLDRLLPVRSIAQSASVIGRHFTYDLLFAILDQPASEVVDALRELEQAVIIHLDDPATRTYSFHHALIRDVAYESLLKRTRQHLHQRVGSALEDQFPHVIAREPQTAAYHFSEAEDPDNAARYWELAGAQAMRRSAYQEASEQFTQALKQLDRCPSGDGRNKRELGLQISVGSAWVAFKGYSSAEVEVAFDRASDLVRQHGWSENWITAAIGRHGFFLLRARYDEALRHSDELIASLPLDSSPRDRSVAACLAGVTRTFMALIPSAREQFDAGIAHWREVPDDEPDLAYPMHPNLICHAYGARIYWLQGLMDRALAMAEEGLTFARSRGSNVDVTQALGMMAGISQARRDVEGTYRYACEAMELSGTFDISYWNSHAHMLRGWAEATQGDADGVQRIQRGLDAYLAAGSRLGLSWFVTLLAEAELAHGNADAALAAVDRGLGHVEATREAYYHPELLRLRSRIQGARGVRHEVGPLLDEAFAVALSQQAKSWQLRTLTTRLEMNLEGDSEVTQRETRQRLQHLLAQWQEGETTGDLMAARQAAAG
ncbi:MAG: adenylate/guanylate cyclase domain-containing protein [Pseudomonadota bacterium]